ncbi:MAG: tyrosine-type recombinase/integrase [Vicinamibacterales bacterium]
MSRRLPQILSVEEVTQLIEAAHSLLSRTMLMVLYSTGMRNAELRHLQVADIDSRRMLIHIQQGKGKRDRTWLARGQDEQLERAGRWCRRSTRSEKRSINWYLGQPIRYIELPDSPVQRYGPPTTSRGQVSPCSISRCTIIFN